MRKRNYLWVLQICGAVCLMGFGGRALSADENIGLFPSYLKELKLDDVKITWGGEYRFRYEYQDNYNFDDEHGRNNNPMYGCIQDTYKYCWVCKDEDIRKSALLADHCGVSAHARGGSGGSHLESTRHLGRNMGGQS